MNLRFLQPLRNCGRRVRSGVECGILFRARMLGAIIEIHDSSIMPVIKSCDNKNMPDLMGRANIVNQTGHPPLRQLGDVEEEGSSRNGIHPEYPRKKKCHSWTWHSSMKNCPVNRRYNSIACPATKQKESVGEPIRCSKKSACQAGHKNSSNRTQVKVEPKGNAGEGKIYSWNIDGNKTQGDSEQIRCQPLTIRLFGTAAKYVVGSGKDHACLEANKKEWENGLIPWLCCGQICKA